MSCSPLFAPALYVVATPLGNLQDMTERARATLAGVSAIACEDTRHTQKLLTHFGVRSPLIAVHEHNEEQAGAGIVERIQNGESIALVSDAGTPGICDPGTRVVRAVQSAGLKVVPVPGACALVTALSGSGLRFSSFYFAGFLPPKAVARRALLERLLGIDSALVFYEAPHRIEETLKDLCDCVVPSREIVIARELTKLFEEMARLPAEKVLAWLHASPHRSRGEFVLMVAPPEKPEGLDADTVRILTCLLEEVPLKTAARLASQITGAPKNALYERALSLKSQA